jgi:preprotein translocase subunit SecE
LAEATAKKSRLKFFGDTIDELRKVSWLKWPQEVVYLSVLVMVVAIAVGLVMGGIDWLFSLFMEKVIIGG